jgi:branched-chain amino acid transport system permease protein
LNVREQLMRLLIDWKTTATGIILFMIAIYPVLHGSKYIMHVMIMFFIWAVVAALWDLLAGYAGVLSMANVGFLLIGGYVSGILVKTYGFSPWIAIFIAGLTTMLIVTLVLALPALRLSGIYIALLTIVFSDTLPTILTQTRKVTGGASGLREVPPLWEGIGRIEIYYVMFVVFLVAIIVIYSIIHSKAGLAFQAMRDDEDLALSLGVNLYREKLKVFAICSFFTGVMGGFYVHYLNMISPGTNSLESFMLALCMVFLGGMGRFPGAIFGAFFLTFANEFLQLAGSLRPLLIGVCICTLILFLPDGFMQAVDWIDKKINKKKDLEPKKPQQHILNILMKGIGIKNQTK